MQQHTGGVSEHELIKELQAAGLFDGWISRDASLALFQKHFAVMHCLYRLQKHYAERGQELFISPLRIQLLAATEAASHDQEVSNSSGGLVDYYTDWAHFEAATPDTVTELLKDFWQRYAAVDQTTVALEALGLGATASWSEIQSQYRRLAAEHHPDRGGDNAAFAQVREAYETLKKVYK